MSSFYAIDHPIIIIRLWHRIYSSGTTNVSLGFFSKFQNGISYSQSRQTQCHQR